MQSTPPYSAQKERFHRSCLCHPEAQRGGQGLVQERKREQTKEGDKKGRRYKGEDRQRKRGDIKEHEWRKGAEK